MDVILARAMLYRMDRPRIYRFSVTVTVEPGQEGYDDPEWIADAAWGSLSNEYGYRCTYGDITELPVAASAAPGSDVAEP